MLYVLLALLLSPFLRRRAGAEVWTILIIQTGKIGDFVCTTPLCRALRRAFPEASLVLAAHPVNRALAAQLPYFDRIIEVPSGSLAGWRNKLRWIRQIRNVEADVAICCSGGLAWPTILSLSGIPRRLGVTPNFQGRSTRFAQRLWTDRVAHDGQQLIGMTYARLLKCMDIGPIDPRTEVRASPLAPERVNEFLAAVGLPERDNYLLGIAISAANKLKEFGLPLLEELCRKLLAGNAQLKIVLLGGPVDQTQAAVLIKALDSDRIVDSCGCFALDEVPALLQRLGVFIGVDSGLTYMADSLNVPLVSLAGPCNMKETRPQNPRVIILQENLPCVPCAHIFRAPYSCRITSRACITGVRADRVADAALRLLAEAGETNLADSA